MIVQSAADGEQRFVITMAEHMTLAGKFGRAFGNDRFEAVEPRDVVLYIVENHDAGWAELDGEAAIDSATGLPFNLVDTPFERIVRTSAASPDFNSHHHAYCGLLSSMHSWGLYNGRYGLSDKVLLDGLAADNRAKAKDMLDGELARQENLKAALADDPDTAGWIEENHLFQNYKQLQFFDTMALYFNCCHEGAREETEFEHVPRNADADETIAVRPEGDGVYGVSPYPFAEDGLEVSFTGRYMTPGAAGGSADLAALPTAGQTIRLVAR